MSHYVFRDGLVPPAPLHGGAEYGPTDDQRCGFSRRLNATPAQISLAWLLSRSHVMVPIPGTRSIAHLEENVASVHLANQLTSEEVDTLTGLVSEPDTHLGVPAQITRDTLRSAKRD